MKDRIKQIFLRKARHIEGIDELASEQDMTFGQRLLRERKSHHWSQPELSMQAVGDKSLVPSIHRWEHDLTVPHLANQAKLCEAFGKPVELWGIKEQKSNFWNVPYLRNPYFTGRDQPLERLHKALAADRVVDSSRIYALSGLGGIGKTQTAIEYAHRYGKEYEAVLWVQANTHEALLSDFAKLAPALKLSKKEDIDQSRAIALVKDWLQNHGPWLLIFDNAEDIAMVEKFLPRQNSGAILLTTRSDHASLHVKSIKMEKMSLEEGIAFLMRRIHSRDEEDENRSERAAVKERLAAKELWELMDGLPLALDQAGAYIRAGDSNLSDYLDMYRQQREPLLQERGGPIEEHPDAVATTWSLSFECVEQQNSAAAELLRFCAFLAPDAIPEELLTTGAEHLTAPLQALGASKKLLIDAVIALRAYSLIRRDPEARMLVIHRLVQAVLVDAMPIDTRKQWKERIVRALNTAFPEAPFKEWTRCEPLLPHVLICATWIEDDLTAMREAASLFDKAGTYLRELGQYAEAEPLLVQALAIREQHLGKQDLATAMSLSSLAGLYSYQGKHKQAEPLVKRALAICQQRLGNEHPGTAKQLHRLAILHFQQGDYELAEPLYQQALAINQQHLGANDPETTRTLNNLAVLYVEQRKYEQAEKLYQQALTSNEQSLGAEHPETARNLGNLALLYVEQEKYSQAELFYKRAISIHKHSSGSKSPDIAYPLFGLAELYRFQRKYKLAERLYQRVLAIREQQLEAEHPDTAEALRGLADLYRESGRYGEARSLYARALAMYEKTLGLEHPSTSVAHERYAAFLQTIEHDTQAGTSASETIPSQSASPC